MLLKRRSKKAPEGASLLVMGVVTQGQRRDG